MGVAVLGGRTLVTVAMSVVVVTATACGGDDEAGQSIPSASGSPAAPQLNLPEGFDNTRGWEISEAGGTEFARPVIAAQAGVVLFRATTSDGSASHIVAHEAATGAPRWSSRPVSRPESKLDTPLFAMGDGGKEYAVLATTGAEGGDNGVDKASAVTRVHVYDASSSGEDVAALHEITVPGTAVGFTEQGGRTLVVRQQNSAILVDVATGKTTEYPYNSAKVKAPQDCGNLVGSCNDGAKIVGITPEGPLVQGHGAFWVPDGWISDDVVPSGASATEGSAEVTVVGAPNDEILVAAWPLSDETHGERMWAAHDSRTGEVQATVKCAQRQDGYGNDAPIDPVLSDDGRYLIADMVSFDLQAKEGRCFGESNDRNEIRLTSVTDDGNAYGEAVRPTRTGGEDKTVVAVSLATGEALPLDENTEIPGRIGAGVGIFGDATNGGESILVYPGR